MQTEHEPFEIRGTYLYTNPAALDRALAAVRVQLDQHRDADRHVDWMGCFVRQGSRLWIQGRLPDAAVRVAASVVNELARDAVEGVVVARRGDLALDYFPCGE